jgi:hypothetical protein
MIDFYLIYLTTLIEIILDLNSLEDMQEVSSCQYNRDDYGL